MATITKRGSGRYQAKVRKRGFPDQSKTFTTRYQAERWAKKVETEMDDGVFQTSEANTMTLAKALDKYETDISSRKKGHKEEKVKIRFWKRTDLADKTLAQIKPLDISLIRDERMEKVSNYTVRNDLALLSHLFTSARKEWGMDGLMNPVSSIWKPPPGKPREYRISDEEQKAILEKAAELESGALLADLIEFAIETGMRRGEIARLRREHVNKRARVAHLPETKNDESRDVPLTTRALAIVKRQPTHISGEVFKNLIIKDLADFMTRGFREAADAAELNHLRFHDTRHEATSRFFEMGFSEMEVSSITGHKTLQMLKRYTHLKAAKLAQRLA